MGERSDKLEKEKRVRAVQDLMLSGHNSGDIRDTIMVKWSLSERQAYRYITDAYKEFRELTQNEMSERKGWHIQARLKLLKQNTGKPKLQLDILDSLAKLEGVLINKVDHTSGGEKLESVVVYLPDNGRETSGT